MAFSSDDKVGLVAKLEVKDLTVSKPFYEKIGLIHDKRWDTARWAQFNVPNVHGAAVGLWEDPAGESSGGSTVTFVVYDIYTDYEKIKADGIPITPPAPTDHGVLESFFQDPDRNKLALRQNPPSFPTPEMIGRE
jgi:predicted enzyme related to lactoylglutathione lyase